MMAIPAIDLRGGACVQLVGGSYAEERLRLDDVRAVPHAWSHAGFRRLHVVDLDAATGRGTNADMVHGLLLDRNIEMQVGGGVRDEARIEELLNEGASAVVLGTKAIEDPDWLAEMALAFPGELIVAADVRGRQVVTRGWSRTLVNHVLDVVDELAALPLAAIMVTAVHLEGQMRGTDLPLMEDVAERSPVPVIASGGITTMEELRSLADRGVAATIIGMALYTGVLDPRAVAEEFPE